MQLNKYIFPIFFVSFCILGLFQEAQANNPTNPKHTFTYHSNISEGTIGSINGALMDYPEDNVFKFNVENELLATDEFYLEFDYHGLASASNIAWSINDNQAVGGYVVAPDSVWRTHKERLPLAYVQQESNQILFNTQKRNNVSYTIKNVRLVHKRAVETSSAAAANISIDILERYPDGSLYLRGKSLSTKPIKSITFNGVKAQLNGSFFELLIQDVDEEIMQDVKLDVQFADETSVQIAAEVSNISARPQIINPFSSVESVSKFLQAAQATSLQLNDVVLEIDSAMNFSSTDKITMQVLRFQDINVLHQEFVNVTEGLEGIRILDEPLNPVAIKGVLKLKYDKLKIPGGYSERDVYTFYFDRQTSKWIKMERLEIDAENNTISSQISESSDYINGVIQSPESPETSGFVPTQFNDIAQASPMAGVQLISPPSANNMGDAKMSYNIEVPPGRNGLQPNLSVNYSSGGGNSWLGLGWNMSVPSINVETRWGVPRYLDDLESDSYIFEGEQLIQMANGEPYLPHRVNVDDWIHRITGAEIQFYKRRNGAGGFTRVIRKGPNPKDYRWEVTDPTGIKYYYGGVEQVEEDAVIKTGDGNIVKWMLVRVEDMFGNYMTYTYQRKSYNVNGGEVCEVGDICATNLYPETIFYTGNSDHEPNYSVAFNITEVRNDKIYSARTGALIMEGSLLNDISVLFENNQLIRRYEFMYEEGAFFKSILTNLTQNDASDQAFTTHQFGYQHLESLYEPESTWDLKREGITIGSLNSLTILGDHKYSSPLSTNSSTGIGFKGYAGIGPPGPVFAPNKNNTLGYAFSNTFSISTGKTQMIDLNGDGLLDKVYRSGGSVYYQPNESRIEDGTQYYGAESELIKEFGTEKQVLGIPGNIFNRSTSDVFGGGIEAGFGKGFGSGLDYQTDDISWTFFRDVNADGLPDLVSLFVVYFNHLDENGIPTFTTDIQNCDCPLALNKIDPNVFTPDTLADTTCTNPIIDLVKMWVAPYDGDVVFPNLTQINYTGELGDGVYVAIESEFLPNPLFVDYLDENQTSPTTSQITYSVSCGERIFFRLRSGTDVNGEYGDGIDDTVDWDPEVRYISPLDHALDVFAKPADRFQYSNEYIESYECINNYWTCTDAFDVRGDISTSETLCDEVRIYLSLEGQDINGVLKQIDIPIKENWPNGNIVSIINKGDKHSFHYRIDCTWLTDTLEHEQILLTEQITPRLIAKSHSNVNWMAVELDIELEDFQEAYPRFGYFQKEFNKIEYLDLSAASHTLNNLNFDFIDPNILDPAQIAQLDANPSTGYLVVKALNTNTNRIEKLGEAKIEINLHDNNGSWEINYTNNFTLNFNTNSDHEDIYYCLNVGSDQWNFLVEKLEIKLDGNTKELSLWTYDILNRRQFGNLYRNWGTFAYSPPQGEDEFDAIDVDLFILDIDLVDTSHNPFEDSIVDPSEGFGPCDIHFYPLCLLKDSNSDQLIWKGLNERVFGTQFGAGSSRLFAPTVIPNNPIPSISIPNVYNAPPIFQYSRSFSMSIGAKIKKKPIGATWSDGYSKMKLDYVDLNGDRIPDVIGEQKLLYSFPNGEFDELVDIPELIDRNEHVLFGISTSYGGLKSKTNDVPETTTAGSTAQQPEGNSGSDNSAPNPNSGDTHTVASKEGASDAGQDADGGDAKLILNLEATVNDDDETYFHRDINGDGLPDHFKYQNDDLKVRINLGYGYTGFISYTELFRGHNGAVFDVDADASYIGISFSGSDSKSHKQFVDVNGDGLLDVLDGKKNPVLFLNTGSTLVNVNNLGLNENTFKSKSVGLSAGFYGAFKFNVLPGPIPPPFLTLAFGGGGSLNGGVSSSSIQFMDIDGDGFPDHLKSNHDEDGTVLARRSNIGTTNYLTKVTGPVGHEIDLEYVRTAATQDHPGGKFVMSSVEVFDGHQGDGKDVIKKHFYYLEGKYHRCEREFLGFGKVVQDDLTGPETVNVYRRNVNEYHTDFFKRGKLNTSTLGLQAQDYNVSSIKVINRQEVANMKANPSGGNSYNLGDIEEINDLDPSMTFCTSVGSTQELFETGQDMYIASDSKLEYDDFGRLHRYYFTDEGGLLGLLTEADYRTEITYHTNTNNNVVSIPNEVLVFTGPIQLLKRKSTTSILKNKITNVKRYHNVGAFSEWDYDYFENGNLKEAIYPRDAIGNRPQYTYLYEPTLETHLSRIEDHFDLWTEFSNWDYRFGLSRHTTNISGNSVTSHYDDKGRMKWIQGPYDNVPAISFLYFENQETPMARTMRKDTEHPGNPIQSQIFTDGLGRTIQTIADAQVWNGTIAEETTIKSGKTIYDAYGRATQTTFPFQGSTPNDFAFEEQETETQSFALLDILDRPKIVVNLGVATLYDYNFGEDKNGVRRKRTRVSAPGGNQTRTYTKGNGSQTTTEQLLDGEWLQTAFNYDGIDQLVNVENPLGHDTYYSYDLQGRMKTRNIPDMDSETYTHDNLGNTTKKTRGNFTIDYKYFTNRLIGIDYNEEAYYDVIYRYGLANDDDFNRRGRMVSMSDATGKQEFWYGALGELIKNRRTIAIPHKTDGATFDTEWTYDSWNRVQTMRYPDGEELSYDYDFGGNLSAIEGNKAAVDYTYVEEIGYDILGHKVHQELGNGVVNTYSYDPEKLWLSNLTSEGAEGIFQNLIYGFDGAGNITGLVNDVNIPFGTTEQLIGESSYTYSYDELYRLKTASGQWEGPKRELKDGTVDDVSDFNLIMTYDEIGNIIEKELDMNRTDQTYPTTLNKNDVIEYTYNYMEGNDGPNQIDKIKQFHTEYIDVETDPSYINREIDHTYGFDGHGNTIGIEKLINEPNPDANYKLNRKLLWDRENRIKAISDDGYVSHYFYDAGGDRVLKILHDRHDIHVNGELSGGFLQPIDYTMYVNPYIVVRSNGQYTKHYYNGAQRITSVIGRNELYDNGTDPSDLAATEELELPNKKLGMEEMMTNNYTEFGIDITDFELLNDGLGELLLPEQSEPGLNCATDRECIRYYFSPDHLGSSSYITDDGGVVIQHLEYVPFGEVFIDEQRTDWSTPYRFTGKEQDCETGLNYYSARYQDPVVGRFLSVDRYADKYTNASPYVYTQNNPVMMIDPTGDTTRYVASMPEMTITAKRIEDTENRSYETERFGHENLNLEDWQTKHGCVGCSQSETEAHWYQDTNNGADWEAATERYAAEYDAEIAVEKMRMFVVWFDMIGKVSSLAGGGGSNAILKALKNSPQHAKSFSPTFKVRAKTKPRSRPGGGNSHQRRKWRRAQARQGG